MSFWDIVQSVQIHNMQNRAVLSETQADIRQSQNRNRHEDLDESLQRVALVVEAMWTLLAEKTGLTEEQLLERIVELDEADGSLDGRSVRPPRRCAGCDAVVPHDRDTCQFCGTAAPSGRNPFSG